jgi:hypothetical protein
MDASITVGQRKGEGRLSGQVFHGV